MIGFRSIQHQGWAAARTGKPEVTNPYPAGSSAFYEFQDGLNAYRRGDVINRNGQIASGAGQ